jgi:hypothetical protein
VVTSTHRGSLVVLLALAVLLAADRIALAQAGSTGGTIGKSDKSVSGGESEPHVRSKQREKAAGCTKIVGTWNWVLGATRQFLPNKTIPSSDRGGGTWTCNGDSYVVKFVDGSEDHLTMSSDGNSMSGVSSVSGYGINFTVTRK